MPELKQLKQFGTDVSLESMAAEIDFNNVEYCSVCEAHNAVPVAAVVPLPRAQTMGGVNNSCFEIQQVVVFGLWACHAVIVHNNNISNDIADARMSLKWKSLISVRPICHRSQDDVRIFLKWKNLVSVRPICHRRQDMQYMYKRAWFEKVKLALHV